MRQVEELVEALEKKYSVSVDRLLELYTRNTPRDEMAETLGTKEWTIRAIMSALNLRGPKKFRQHDYSYFLSRFGDASSVELVEELQEANESLDQLSKDLVAKEQQLKKARRELSKYRRAHGEPLDVSDIVRGLSKPTELPTVISMPQSIERYTRHTQFILLSDLHFEATVDQDDVGMSNTYTWSIAESRLNKVFEGLKDSHRGETSCVVMLGGDMLDGLIHSSLETSSKPLGKAVAELAKILSEHISRLSYMYDQVHVSCVSGNHERITDYKRSHNQGFGFAYLLYQMIDALLSTYGNVGVDISTNGYAITYVSDALVPVGLMHGDYIKGTTNDIKILKTKEAFRQATGLVPTHIFSGHTHIPEVRLSGSNDHWVCNGSLIGTNAYSHTNGFTGTDWAQTIGCFDNQGKVDYIKFIGG